MKAFAKTNFTMLAMLFAGTLALAVVSVLAQTSQSTPSVQGQTLSGNVVNVDSPGKVIKIKDDQGKEIIIYVDSGTKMQSLEKSLELSDIKAGDHVVVSVKGDSGRMLATAITVHKAQQSAESSTTSSSTGSTTGTAYDTKSDNPQSDIATTATPDKEQKASSSTLAQSSTSSTTSSSTESTTATTSDSKSDTRQSDIAATATPDREQRASSSTLGQSSTPSTTSSSTESARSDLRNTDMMDRSQRISKTDETTTTSTMARTSDYDSSQSAVSTGRLPKTATPLPLVGMIGLLLVSAGAVARKIFG